MQGGKKEGNPLVVLLAFAILYIVWGSTYFFIQKAIEHIPALLLGALRFIAAGLLMMAWCVFRGEKLFDLRQIKHAAITGLLMLLVGNGALIWAEKTIPSSLAAVLVASEALWLVVLDKPKWKENLGSMETMAGLVIGFIGVMMLFGENAAEILGGGQAVGAGGFLVLVIGTIAWAAGSLYSKEKTTGSALVNAAWQMLVAGIAFVPFSLLNNEWAGFDWRAVSAGSWLSVLYLVTMGSLAGYTAYVWLLQVRSVTLVSTHVYVNPVVAVLLGVFFANEHMSALQVGGLGVILASVVLINLRKYRKKTKLPDNNIPPPAMEKEVVYKW